MSELSDITVALTSNLAFFLGVAICKPSTVSTYFPKSKLSDWFRLKLTGYPAIIQNSINKNAKFHFVTSKHEHWYISMKKKYYSHTLSSFHNSKVMCVRLNIDIIHPIAAAIITFHPVMFSVRLQFRNHI